MPLESCLRALCRRLWLHSPTRADRHSIYVVQTPSYSFWSSCSISQCPPISQKDCLYSANAFIGISMATVLRLWSKASLDVDMSYRCQGPTPYLREGKDLL